MPTGHQPHIHTAHTASHRRRLSHHARSNSSTSLSSMGVGKGGGRSAGLGMTAAAITDDRPGRRRKSGGEAVLKPSPSQTDLRARSSSSHRSRSSHRRSSSTQRNSSAQRATSVHRTSVSSQHNESPPLRDEPPLANDQDEVEVILSSSAVTKVDSIELEATISPSRGPAAATSVSPPSPPAESAPGPAPHSSSPSSPLSPSLHASAQVDVPETSEPLPSPFAEDSTSSSPPANVTAVSPSADGHVVTPPASASMAASSPIVAPPPPLHAEQQPKDSSVSVSQPLAASPPRTEPIPTSSRPGKEPVRSSRYPPQLCKASSKSSLLSLVTRPNLLPKRLSSLSAHPSLAAAPQISTEAALSSPTISRGSEGLVLSDGNDERTAAGHLRKASFGSFNSAAPPRGRTPSVAGSIRSDRGGVLGSTAGGGSGSAVDSLTALRSATTPHKGRPEGGMPRRRIASSASSTSLADLAEGVKRSVFSTFLHGSGSGHPNRSATSSDDVTPSAITSRPSQTPKPPPLVKSHFIRPLPSATAVPKNPVLHPSPFLDAHTSLLRGMQASGRDSQSVDVGRTPMGMSIRRCLLLTGDAGPSHGSAHSAGIKRSAGTSIVSAR